MLFNITFAFQYLKLQIGSESYYKMTRIGAGLFFEFFLNPLDKIYMAVV